MTIRSEEIDKLFNECKPWYFFNQKTENMELRSDTPPEVIEKEKKMRKLYQDMINTFPIGCQ